MNKVKIIMSLIETTNINKLLPNGNSIKPIGKSRMSDGNMYYSPPNDSKPLNINATVKLDGSQTNIYVTKDGYKILTHNDNIVFDSITGTHTNFLSKDFTIHVRNNQEKFIKTFNYLKEMFLQTKEIIISCEYMFPKCGNLLRYNKINSNPYPPEMIGNFFAFELQIIMEDDTRTSIRISSENIPIYFKYLNCVPLVFEGELNLTNFKNITDWLISNATVHEGVIITLTEPGKPIGSSGGFKLRTAITDTSDGPDTLAEQFEPSETTFAGLILQMYNETKIHVKDRRKYKKLDNTATHPKKLKVKMFDFNAINQTIKKVLGHDSYDITMQSELREAICAQMVKDKLCLDKGFVSEKATHYINGITTNMEKFFQNKNFI